MEKKLKGIEGTLLIGCSQNIRPFNFQAVKDRDNFPLTSFKA
jgi:hypothetical protein